jgi:hypothetical protein
MRLPTPLAGGHGRLSAAARESLGNVAELLVRWQGPAAAFQITEFGYGSYSAQLANMAKVLERMTIRKLGNIVDSGQRPGIYALEGGLDYMAVSWDPQQPPPEPRREPVRAPRRHPPAPNSIPQTLGCPEGTSYPNRGYSKPSFVV